MKILYLHTDPLPSEMAGSVFSLSTAIGMAQAGHDTTLVMPSAGRTVDFALAYYGQAKPDNLTIKLPAPQKVRIGPMRFTYTPRYYRALYRLVRNTDADAAIVRTLRLAAYLIDRGLPCPIIYEIHNWYGDIQRKWVGADWMVTPKKLAKEKKLSLLEKRTLPKVSGILAMREATAGLCRELYPGIPVGVAQPGLDLPAELPPAQSEPVVAYLGQLHTHKGIDVLLQAAKLAPEIRLLIMGGGDMLPHWQARARELGIADRVTYTGHVEKRDVPANLAKARIGVLPLLDCFYNRYLTSPLKIMEYFSAGLPVVTVDGPVTAELVQNEKTGLLAPFDDPAAFAGCMKRLCTDDALYTQCRANIKAGLPDWTWKRRGEKIGAFAEQIK